MKYLVFIFLSSICITTNAQHWPTYMFQHDSIYKKNHVKSFLWKGDSTKSSVEYEVNLDTNGRVIKIESLDPTINYEYDKSGKLIAEWDWDGDAVLSYDTLGRVISKIVYHDNKKIARKDSISYYPKIVKSTRYDEEGKLIKKKECYFDTETTVKTFVVTTPILYEGIKYNYLNVFNSNGQIIQTTNMTIVGQAFYEYHKNGLLNTIKITHSFRQSENGQPIIQKLIYTYY